MRRDLFHTRDGILAARGGPVRSAVAHHPHHERRDAGADFMLMLHAVHRRAHHGIVGDDLRHPRRRVAVVDPRRRIPMLSSPSGASCAGCIPEFMKMQERIDRREPGAAEQISRHPGRPRVRARARRDRPLRARQRALTETALKAGRLLALMFPPSMLVLNLSSVAVVWFGAHRIASGEMQVGALVAFLTYLIQILSAVMMATFMLMMMPARGGVREAHPARCSTPLVGRAARDAVARSPGAVSLELRGVGFRYPGAEPAGAVRHHRQRRRRADASPSSGAPAPARPRCST